MARSSTPPHSRTVLRNRLREQRRGLSAEQQRRAALRLDRIVGHSALFRRSRHIAFFLANDGELDPQTLLHRAWRMGKTCYLPIITPAKSLWFAPYAPGDPLALNRFAIPEPAAAGLTRVPARVLDLILTPLVAFDDRGHRLGMGSGFYDRTLSFLRHRHAWRKPRLLGIAHELQHLAALPAAPWDVPLDGVATDEDLYLFSNK
ncbi:MAG: 5-formyltetrahydrofolate cyclo-ligase [Gammaproteobacteria bacterium]